MKKFKIKINKKQATHAHKLCIDNVNSFIKDIEILLKEDKFDHIIIPIQFAMEELGKSKILEDKISNSKSNEITITENDGWLDHKKKVEIVSEFIELPSYQKELLESLAGHLPMFFPPDLSLGLPFGFTPGFPPEFLTDVIEDDEIEELKDKAKKGHLLRLESSFVGFDRKTGDPILREKLPREDVIEYLLILKEGLIKIEKSFLANNKERTE